MLREKKEKKGGRRSGEGGADFVNRLRKSTLVDWLRLITRVHF
jgi:hypothetical protein